MIRATLGLFCCWALQLPAQTAEQTPIQTTSMAAAQLAARMSSLLPHRGTVSFEFQNLTSLPTVLPPAEWSSFPSQLRDEFRRAGLEIAATPLEPHVRVTLAESSRGLLLIAEISNGDNRQVAMLPWSLPSPAETRPPVALSQEPLWTQAEPILDVLMNTESEMLVLSPHQMASFRSTEGKWAPDQTASLMLTRPMPRDPRGRLEPSPVGFRAYLPVATCEGTVTAELKVTCAPGTATWQSAPVHWVADRNVLEPAGDDGAKIADPCGSGTVELTSSPDNEHDSVRAYQVVNGQATALSDALPTPGPVTALWASGSGRDATLVVHNLQTGEYEASRLLVACVQ